MDIATVVFTEFLTGGACPVSKRRRLRRRLASLYSTFSGCSSVYGMSCSSRYSRTFSGVSMRSICAHGAQGRDVSMASIWCRVRADLWQRSCRCWCLWPRASCMWFHACIAVTCTHNALPCGSARQWRQQVRPHMKPLRSLSTLQVRVPRACRRHCCIACLVRVHQSHVHASCRDCLSSRTKLYLHLP